MTLDEIMQHINTYLEDGSPAEALERLDELLEEINDTVREPLKCDVLRASRAGHE